MLTMVYFLADVFQSSVSTRYAYRCSRKKDFLANATFLAIFLKCMVFYQFYDTLL